MAYNAPNNTPAENLLKTPARIHSTPELDRLIIQHALIFRPWIAPHGEKTQRWEQVWIAIRAKYELPHLIGSVRSVSDRWRVLQRKVQIGGHDDESNRDGDSGDGEDVTTSPSIDAVGHGGQTEIQELLQIQREMLVLQRRQLELMEADREWKDSMVTMLRGNPGT